MNGSRKAFAPVWLMLLVISVSACGWHLRGMESGAPTMEGIAVAVHSRPGPGPLSREITAALQAAGADVVDRMPGVPTLVIHGEQRGTRNISGGRQDETQEYELRYEVQWELRDGQGETLIEQSAIQQVRSFRFQQTQVLGSERREDMVVAELRRDVAMLLRDRVRTTLGQISGQASGQGE